MKANSILFLLLLLVSSAMAQPVSKLGALNTDAAIQRMVRSLDDYYKNFVVDSRLRFADKRVQQLYRREKIKAWEKADIDGNGLPDILITGTHHDEESKVICVLDMGDSLLLEDFSRQFYRYCPVARIVYEGSQPLVAYADYGKPFLITEPLGVEGGQEFLLTYRFSGLIEYNPTPGPSVLPDSIEYSSDFAYHDVEEVEIKVNPHGRVVYHSCEYPVLDEARKTCEDLTATLDSASERQLAELLNYLQPDKLSREYRLGFNHVLRISLYVLYADGRRIQVEDTGGIGSFGLTRLYACLESLRKTHKWAPIKK